MRHKSRSFLRMSLALASLLRAPGVQASPPDPPDFAIVYALSGSASVQVPPQTEPQPVELFQWLPDGARVVAGAGSSLSIAVHSGRRYELRDGAKATVGKAGLYAAEGQLVELPAVPALPRLDAAAADPSGNAIAAVRIRASSIPVYPREGTRVLADGAVLRFQPVAGASLYQVRVEDETGRRVFEVHTRATEVAVPSGVLEPEAAYVWSVLTLDRTGKAAEGRAEFSTLGAEEAARRDAFRKSVLELGDASSLALLAELDRSLGLLAEARGELQAALERAPREAGLRVALERLEGQMWPGRQ